MIPALLAFLALADTTCGGPALCDLVARAALANRALPAAAYTGVAETEAAVIGVRERRIDGPTSVDQTASRVRWERDGTFTQNILAFRSATTTLPLNRVRYLLLGWITPVTTGDRLPVFGRQLGMARHYAWPPEDTASVYARHPLAADRDQWYDYVSADTTTWLDPAGGSHRVARVRVRSRNLDSVRGLLFDGELWLELAGLHLVRLRGRLLNLNAPPLAGVAQLIRAPDRSFIDLENAPVEGVWLPAVQRFEWVQVRPLTDTTAGGLRIVTRFREMQVEPAPPPATAEVPPRYVLSAEPSGTLSAHTEMLGSLGRQVDPYELTDFDDLRLGKPGDPRGRTLGIEELYPGEVIRLNRIEGIFAGVGVTYRARSALPGTGLHVGLGYGFWDQQVRGDVLASWRIDDVVLGAFAARQLEHTNEFVAQFANISQAALFSRDNWDYVDRREAGVRVAWAPLRGHGDVVSLSVSEARDDSVTRELETVPWVGWLRNNRGIYEGDYFRVRAQVELRPDIGIGFVRDGVGVRLEGEIGSGSTISYQRLVARVLARKNLPFMYVTGQFHVGKVWGDKLPPQQLLEFGGAVGLPGYDYKIYAGDVAALGRVRFSFPLPFLRQPTPLGRGFAIPSLGPQFSAGIQGGWSDVTTPAAERAMAGLGAFFDTHTGQLAYDPVTGEPVPASTASDRVRVSLDVRLTLFNDALGVGVAQPINSTKGTALIFVWGQQF